MTREQLEHAIRAACEVSEDSEIWIFGSQAILGELTNICVIALFSGYNPVLRNYKGNINHKDRTI
jgi:hypothetical protein